MNEKNIKNYGAAALAFAAISFFFPFVTMEAELFGYRLAEIKMTGFQILFNKEITGLVYIYEYTNLNIFIIAAFAGIVTGAVSYYKNERYRGSLLSAGAAIALILFRSFYKTYYGVSEIDMHFISFSSGWKLSLFLTLVVAFLPLISVILKKNSNAKDFTSSISTTVQKTVTTGTGSIASILTEKNEKQDKKTVKDGLEIAKYSQTVEDVVKQLKIASQNIQTAEEAMILSEIENKARQAICEAIDIEMGKYNVLDHFHKCRK